MDITVNMKLAPSATLLVRAFPPRQTRPKNPCPQVRSGVRGDIDRFLTARHSLVAGKGPNYFAGGGAEHCRFRQFNGHQYWRHDRRWEPRVESWKFRYWI